jgi:outer membrane protein assembly factor BamB
MRRALLILCLAALLAGCQVGPSSGPADSTDELFAAARAGDLEEVRRLLEAGVPVDSVDRYGATALLMAAGAGHIDVVTHLLEQGADIDHREEFYGGSPLQMALFGGHPEVAAALVRAGADERELAMRVAIGEGDLELARAAASGGPFHESALAELRAGAAELDPEFQKILEGIESRPDPEPPVLTAEDRKRYEGDFEGQTSDLRVKVTAGPEGLLVSLDGGEVRPLAVVSENTFRSEDGDLEAGFYGRAGSIEGLRLRQGDGPPENLRHIVAEILGPEAFQGEEEVAAVAPEEGTVHWPAFRGRNASGIGDGADTLTTWNVETGEGIRWQADIAGLGNSSPVVWGDRVFLTTAVAEGIPQEIQTGLTGSGEQVDEEVEHRWLVLAFDKGSGEKLWETEVGRGVPLTRRHFKASQANSTPVTDGEHLVVVFPTAGIACLDLDGNIRWQHALGGLNAGAFTDPGMEWGFASSPILYGSRVILQSDTHDGAYLAAWELESGKEAWRVERDVAPSWATPTLLHGEAGDELVVNGSTIHGYNPATGEELWSLGPNSELVIATPVAGEDVVYVSAGYPPVKPIYALRAGTRQHLEVDPEEGHERLQWSYRRGGAYMPSPILYRGIYYLVHHNGRLVAYDAAGGGAIYKSRFSRGGVFTASPVAVNGKLYLPTEEGLLYVLEAGPEYRELAVNDLGEPLMATPAVSEGLLFIRTPTRLVAVGGDERIGG